MIAKTAANPSSAVRLLVIGPPLDDGTPHRGPFPGLQLSHTADPARQAEAVASQPLVDGGCLEFDHELGEREAADTQQRAWWAHSGGRQARSESAHRAEKGVDVGGVDVEPHDVRQRHARALEDRLEIVERHGNLRHHVTRVLRLPSPDMAVWPAQTSSRLFPTTISP